MPETFAPSGITAPSPPFLPARSPVGRNEEPYEATPEQLQAAAVDPATPYEATEAQLKAGEDSAPYEATPGQQIRGFLASHKVEDLAKDYGLDFYGMFNEGSKDKGWTAEDTAKLSDAQHLRDARGLAWDAFWHAASGVIPGLWGTAKGIFKAGKAFSLTAAAKELSEKISQAKTPDEISEAWKKMALERAGEAAAGLESAGGNIVDLLRKGVRFQANRLKHEFPISSFLPEQAIPEIQADITHPETFFESTKTPEGRLQKFIQDAGTRSALQQSVTGQGRMLELLGIDAATAAKEGVKFDPEVIQGVAFSADPMTWVPALGAFKALRIVKGAGVYRAVDAAGKTIVESASKPLLDRMIQGAASKVEDATAYGSDVFKSVFPGPASAIGSMVALATGHPIPAAGILGAKTAAKAALKAIEVGAKVAGSDLVADSAGQITRGAAGGAAFMAPFALVEEHPEEQLADLMTGATLGAAIGAGAVGVKQASWLARRAIEHAVSVPFQTAAELRPVKRVTLTFDNLSQEPKAQEMLKLLEAETQDQLSQMETMSPNDANIANRTRAVLNSAGITQFIVSRAFAEANFPELLNRKEGAAGITLKDSTGKPVLDSNGKEVKVSFRVREDNKIRSLTHETGHDMLNSGLISPEERAALLRGIRETPGYEQRFNQEYLSSEGLTPEQRAEYEKNPARLEDEILADLLGHAMEGANLDGVTEGARKTVYSTLSRVLDRLGLTNPGEYVINKGASGAGSVSRFGTVHSETASVVARRILDRVMRDASRLPPEDSLPAEGAKPSATPPPLPSGVKPPPLPTPGEVKPPPLPTEPKIQPPPLPGPTEIKPAPAPSEPPKVVPPVEPPKPAEPSSVEPPKPAPDNVRGVAVSDYTPFTGKSREPARERLSATATAMDAESKDLSPENRAAVKQLVSNPGAPHEIVYDSAKETGSKQAESYKLRREEVEAARNDPNMRALATKIFNIPLDVAENGKQLVMWSGDALLTNIRRVVDQADTHAKMAAIPYEMAAEGRKFKDGGAQLAQDIVDYTRNQNNGYRGDGEKLNRPSNPEGFIPDENPNYNPVSIPKDRAQFINALMGENPPATARITKGITPVQVRARRIAALNDRAGVPTGPVFKTPFEGVKVADFNPWRVAAEKAGFNFSELNPVHERLNFDRIKSAKPVSGVKLEPTATDVTAAGFLPAKEALEAKAMLKDAETPEVIRGAGYLPPEPPRFDPTALFIPVEGVDSRPIYAGESVGLTPVRFMPSKSVPGGEHSTASPSYPDAVKEAVARGGNAWVRQSADPTNKGRVLLVQFTPDLMYPNGPDPVSTPYYDKLYSGVRKGYSRGADFWELPQWAAVATHNLGGKADFYAVRNMAEAKKFLAAADYDRVAFSVMDVSKALTEELVPHIKGEVDLGGYTDREGAAKLSEKAHIWNTMNEFIEAQGLKYQKGFDYRHFRGTEIIPRLELSAGCRHRCTFCTIDRVVTNSTVPEINAQVDSFKDLNAKLVYLNDKTFGQSPNVAEMPRLYEQMKAANPEFEGFVIQTTAAQMKLFSDEFLQKAGIRYIELGVETYNDPILKSLRKPATEKLIDEGVEKMRRLGINFIPNIVIGFPDETAASYARTMEFLRKNEDIISHVNTYNLAIYKGTEISQKVEAKTAADADENSPNKSFYKDPKIHEDFARQIHEYGSQQLSKPIDTQNKARAFFMPTKTELGQRVASDQNLQLTLLGAPKQGFVTFDWRTPEYVSVASLGLALKGPESAKVASVFVDPEFRNKGLGEALYREAASYLQSEGVKELTGEEVNTDQVPTRIRERVFGQPPEVKIRSFASGKPGEKVQIRSLTSRIEPDAQFMPVKNYWMDEKGNLEKVDNHFDSGVKLLRRLGVPESEWSKDPNDPTADLYPAVFAHKYVRVVHEPGRGIFAAAAPGSYSRLNKAQKSALEDLAFEHNLPLDYGDKNVMEAPRPDEFWARYPEPGQGFMPRKARKAGEVSASAKATDPYAKYNVASASSRETQNPTGWILPDNSYEPLETNFHERDLANNRQRLNKEFGTKFSKVEDVAQRQDALNAGFVRIRSSPNGNMVVEVGKDYWDKRKGAILAHALRHADDINDFVINVLNRRGGTVASKSANVFMSGGSPEEAIRDTVGSVKVARVTGEHGEAKVTKIQAARMLPGAESAVTYFQPIKEAPSRPQVEDQLEFGKPPPPVNRYDRSYFESLSPEEQRAYFPEAIFPEKRTEPISSNLVGSPVVKEMGREKAVEFAADRLVDEYNSNPGPERESGEKWYSNFVPKLQKFFGRDSQLFAELLAATSPRNAPRPNFNNAWEAYRLYKAGWFDKLIGKFEEGLDKVKDGSLLSEYEAEVPERRRPQKISDATLINWWIDKHDLKPTKAPRLNGKTLDVEDSVLYNQVSDTVLKVVARRWMKENAGLKTNQFVRNLIGKDHGATIDMWADRTLREALYKGYQDRWRIQPENLQGVTDEDFHLGQAIFKRAADKLGMEPDALQGALWFTEKAKWAKNGWAPIDLGSYEPPLNELIAKGPLKAQIRELPASREEALTQTKLTSRTLKRAEMQKVKAAMAEIKAAETDKKRQIGFDFGADSAKLRYMASREETYPEMLQRVHDRARRNASDPLYLGYKRGDGSTDRALMDDEIAAELRNKRLALEADSAKLRYMASRNTAGIKSPEELKNVLRSPKWAIVTATQESKGDGTSLENTGANDALRGLLIRNKVPFLELNGTYKGVPQGTSFLMVGVSEAQAVEMGKLLQQESVLVPSGLLYVKTGKLNPAEPKNDVFGPKAASLDFFSTAELPEGETPFSLGLDFSKEIEHRKATTP